MTTPASLSCPKCGAALAADSPEGLCPRCLAAASLVGETELPGDEAAPAAPISLEEIAAHFPQLEILSCLGRGGMGIVYKARQRSLNRLVALKLLAPERVHDAAFAERFAREAQALAALSHPGIVTVYDFGEAGRFFFLLMEFVDGVNLRQAMQAGRFTPEQALAIVPPVCEALQFAHEHGIVHRDIKPENLLLDKAGHVKIADFGIAKMLNVEGSEVGFAETQPAGTPQYMAPEQKEHRRTDHRADIYSLGVVLYELLTGELPASKLQAPSRKVQIDVRLDEIVLRALERTPELRYQTAGEFRTQLETLAGSQSRTAAEAVTELNPAARSAGEASPVAYAAFLLAALSGGLGIIAWNGLPQPSRAAVWASLGCALLGLLLALFARRTWLGKFALLVASLNAAIWLAVSAAAPDALAWLHHPRPARAEEVPSPVPSVSAPEGPPFIAHLPRVSVELFALAPIPPAQGPAWQADGSPATEEFPAGLGGNWAEGKVVRGMAFHIRSQGAVPSSPVIRFAPESGFGSMGSITSWGNRDHTEFTYAVAIVSPPAARRADLEVGVADGEWENVLMIDKPSGALPMASNEATGPDGRWAANFEAVDSPGGEAAVTTLIYHYSSRDDCETRLVSVTTDGVIHPLESQNGSHSQFGMTNSFTRLAAVNYAKIRIFRLQKRPYQWVKFRHVSLQAGTKTAVEISDFASVAPTDKPAAEASPIARSAPGLAAKTAETGLASPDLLATPPQLRLLAWQDQNPAGDWKELKAWQPNGDLQAPSRLFRYLMPGVLDNSSLPRGKEARVMELWFSHPLLDEQSGGRLRVTTPDGKLVPAMEDAITGATKFKPDEDNDNLGWMACSFTPEPQPFAANRAEAQLPPVVNVELEYSLGPWTPGPAYSAAPRPGAMLTEPGITDFGENREGRGFVTFERTKTERAAIEEEFRALTHDGRLLTPFGSAVTSHIQTELVTYDYNASIRDIKEFQTRTRPIKHALYKNVSFVAGTKTEVQVVRLPQPR